MPGAWLRLLGGGASVAQPNEAATVAASSTARARVAPRCPQALTAPPDKGPILAGLVHRGPGAASGHCSVF